MLSEEQLDKAADKAHEYAKKNFQEAIRACKANYDNVPESKVQIGNEEVMVAHDVIVIGHTEQGVFTTATIGSQGFILLAAVEAFKEVARRLLVKGMPMEMVGILLLFASEMAVEKAVKVVEEEKSQSK